MLNFFKGIVVGLGGIAPGLSGSVLLVLFGLYDKTINAISTIFKSFKKNVKFLFPLVVGICLGVVLFSKVVDYFLTNYEMYTRYAFFGLILGTLPLFYKEVRKKGFNNLYYIVIAVFCGLGIVIFWLTPNLFPTVTEPQLWQSVVMGFAYAGSAIVPGIDSAAIMTALGLYEAWVKATASLDFTVLIPAACGLAVGALFFAFTINKLIKKFYTFTFSAVFGLFLSVVPSVLREGVYFATDKTTLIAFGWMILGLTASLLFSNIEKLTSTKK